MAYEGTCIGGPLAGEQREADDWVFRWPADGELRVGRQHCYIHKYIDGPNIGNYVGVWLHDEIERDAWLLYLLDEYKKLTQLAREFST